MISLIWSLWQSSDIFGNFRKFSENVRERSSGLRNNFGKSSESGRKSSEHHQKRRHQFIYKIKEHYTLARRYEFYVLVARTISHSFAALTREILGSFRLEYEYEYDFSSFHASHYHNTYTFHPMSYSLYLIPTWRTRALEMSLAWNSKIVLVLNLVLVVRSKAP